MIGPHRLQERLSQGQKVFGPILNFNSPWFVDICGLIGFDFVLLDAEHGPLSAESCEAMMRAAEAAGMSVIVRVPVNAPHEILRFLDVGAVAIQVPHVESAAEARAAAEAVRYGPQGTRGLAATTRAAGYGADTAIRSYTEMANRHVMCLAMIETARGVDQVEAIAGTEGVDAVVLGPADLSQSMGYGGDTSVPAVQEAISHVVGRAKAKGKWVSLNTVDVAGGRKCVERGADIVVIGTAGWLVRTGRNVLAEMKKPA